MRNTNLIKSRIMVIYNNVPDNIYKLNSFSKKVETIENKTRKKNTLEGIELEKDKLKAIEKDYLLLLNELNLYKNNAYYINALSNGISHVVLIDNTMIVLEKDYQTAKNLKEQIFKTKGVSLNVQSVNSIKELIEKLKSSNKPFNEKAQNCIEQNAYIVKNYNELFNLKDSDFY